MAKDKATKEPVVLWTPWGTERTWRPGERFAALRRLALRLRKVRRTAEPKEKDGGTKGQAVAELRRQPP